jgi:hypothetical protein
METYKVSTTTDEGEFSQELPNTVITGHPYLEHIAQLCIFNSSDSTKRVRVKSIEINELNPITTTVQVKVATSRITALTGGNTITPISLDTNNAALPSQVSAVKNATTVTTTGANLQTTANASTQNMVTAPARLISRTGMMGNISTSRIHTWKDATTAEMQKITLREGQGITLYSNSISFYTTEYEVNVWVRNASSGACYIFRTRQFSTELPFVSLLNGSGSGVVLEVFNIEMTECGEATYPQYTCEYVDQAYSDTTLSAISYDSTNSFDSNIKLYKNAVVKTGGWKDGAIISQAWKMKNAGVSSGTRVGQTKNMPLSITPNYVFRSCHEDNDILLSPGKGLAILQRNVGKIGRHELCVTFLQEDMSVGGGPVASEHSYLFMGTG